MMVSLTDWRFDSERVWRINSHPVRLPVYYSRTVPFFQDSAVANAVDDVVGMGIPYFSSAGNIARRSWYTDQGFVDSGFTYNGGKLHDFNPSTTDTDTIQDIQLQQGGEKQRCNRAAVCLPGLV
jgi:hypothetical protein